MTATLPTDVQQVFERFVTTEYTTIDRNGQPITWPVTPYYEPGGPCIDVTTGLGYPKKANDARRNPKVALLFSEPNGSGLENPPQVLVQGIAEVDDHDLDANRERYARESVQKLPKINQLTGPKFIRRTLGWYYTRVYVHVRPERVYVWPDGEASREPQLLDAHLEEVRSGHDEEPDAERAETAGREPVWDERMEELGHEYRTAVLSLVAPDGFPFSLRLPIEVDPGARRIRLGGGPLGVPFQPGLACVTAHSHHPEFIWQKNFQVRGDLVEEDGAWALVPHRLVGGMEAPDESLLASVRRNGRKMMRWRRIAKRELQARERRSA